MIWSPAKLAAAGIALWLFVRVVAPVEERIPMDFWATSFIVLCYLAFFVGVALEPVVRSKPSVAAGTLALSSQYATRPLVLLVATVVGLIGFVFRYIDRVYLRAVDYSLEAAAIREQLETADASVFGMIGAIMLPACYLPALLLIGTKRKGGLKHLWWALPLFAVPVVEAVAQLSRSVFLVAAALMFVTLVAQRFEGNPFKPKLIIYSIITLIALAMFSSAIFSTRLDNVGMTLEYSIMNSVYAQVIGPDTTAIEGIHSGDDTKRLWYAAVVPNSLYLVSGLYEFSVLWNRPDEQYFMFGAYNLETYVRVLELVTGLEIMPVYAESAMYRTGIFSSFFGPLWVDVGWFSPIAMVVFGYFVGRLADTARYKSFHWRPLYFLLATTVIYFPVLNVLTFGQGTFMFTAFVIYGVAMEVGRYRGEIAPAIESNGDFRKTGF